MDDLRGYQAIWMQSRRWKDIAKIKGAVKEIVSIHRSFVEGRKYSSALFPTMWQIRNWSSKPEANPISRMAFGTQNRLGLSLVFRCSGYTVANPFRVSHHSHVKVCNSSSSQTVRIVMRLKTYKNQFLLKLVTASIWMPQMTLAIETEHRSHCLYLQSGRTNLSSRE